MESLIRSGTQNIYWLGGTDEEVEGEWKWITGEVWDFTNWVPGEPNDEFYQDRDEDYLSMYRISSYGFEDKWNDEESNGDKSGDFHDLINHGFICKFSDDESNTQGDDTDFDISEPSQNDSIEDPINPMVAYKRFLAMDEAAKDWAFNQFSASSYVGLECAAFIFQYPDGNYSYTWTTWGGSGDVTITEEFIPKGATIVGAIHTHPVDVIGHFSSGDKKSAQDGAKEYKNFVAYTVAPTWFSNTVTVAKYNPSNGKTTVVASDMSVLPLPEARKKELISNLRAQGKL